MDPSQVVAPDLFDAIAQPDVMLPLVMANAMSPRLWRLARRVAGADDPLEAARRVVDTSFTHALPEQVAAMAGYLDLHEERGRLGPAVVDRAIAEIHAGWDERRRRGLLSPDDDLQEVMASGRFPAYAYANVDVIHTARRLPGGPGQRPRGLTSCLDEAALFAALLVTAPEVTARLDGIAVMASSLHCTVFGWTGDEGWWFWSKRDLFTRAAFAERVRDHHGGDPTDAIEALMAAPIRRITSRRGSLDTTTGRCSLPPDELRRTLAAVRRFFGVLPDGLQQLDGEGDHVQFTPPSAHDALFARVVDCRSADEVRQVVRTARQGGGPECAAATQALLAFRSLELPDLMPYLEAARRAPGLDVAVRGRITATGTRAVDEVLAIAEGPADAPALGDASRIALPHEALARGSCSPQERGLLIHVLLERTGLGPARTVLTRDDAVTRAGDLAVRASDLSRVDPRGVPADGPALAGVPGT